MLDGKASKNCSKLTSDMLLFWLHVELGSSRFDNGNVQLLRPTKTVYMRQTSETWALLKEFPCCAPSVAVKVDSNGQAEI